MTDNKTDNKYKTKSWTEINQAMGVKHVSTWSSASRTQGNHAVGRRSEGIEDRLNKFQAARKDKVKPQPEWCPAEAWMNKLWVLKFG